MDRYALIADRRADRAENRANRPATTIEVTDQDGTTRLRRQKRRRPSRTTADQTAIAASMLEVYA